MLLTNILAITHTFSVLSSDRRPPTADLQPPTANLRPPTANPPQYYHPTICFEMRESLVQFIENEIIPRYANFDAGHREDHARNVIEQGLYLSEFYDVDREMVYVACACHDLGLRDGREEHHLSSGKIIREELHLDRWFSSEQIETIAAAAEDHRASSKREPRSIYGRIVAEADRLIDAETVIRRTVQFGLDHYPELDKEGHWQRTLLHLEEKYADGGYLRLWIPESPNAQRLEALRMIIRDRQLLRSKFDRISDSLTALR